MEFGPYALTRCDVLALMVGAAVAAAFVAASFMLSA
jgi:hypothetical protein